MATTKAATAKTEGSTPKPDSKNPTTTKGSSGNGAGGWGGSTRTTSAVRGNKTVKVCFDESMNEIKCPADKKLSGKNLGIIIGVVVGVVVLIILLLILKHHWPRKNRKGVRDAEEEVETPVEEKAESPVLEQDMADENNTPAVGYEYDQTRANATAGPGAGAGYQPPAPNMSYETPAPTTDYEAPSPIQNDYHPPAPDANYQPASAFVEQPANANAAPSGFQLNAAPRAAGD